MYINGLLIKFQLSPMPPMVQPKDLFQLPSPWHSQRWCRQVIAIAVALDQQLTFSSIQNSRCFSQSDCVHASKNWRVYLSQSHCDSRANLFVVRWCVEVFSTEKA